MNWHSRFRQQARWTLPLRQNLIQRFKLDQSKLILDVGCGTGVLSRDFAFLPSVTTVGVDINLEFLQEARLHTPTSHLVQANALQLPHPKHTFNLTFCHFVLLWIRDPIVMLHEMVRVTQPGGMVAAFAEPDYGGRIDFPEQMELLASAQISSLKKQGADPMIGRKLMSLFFDAGLKGIECGLLGGQWNQKTMVSERDEEWAVFEADLANAEVKIDPIRLRSIKREDETARQKGTRILFVPTFYALGFVPA